MRVVFDAERLRSLNSGLGQFCKAMGAALIRNRPADADLTFIVPRDRLGIFGPAVSHQPVAWWQRFRPAAPADVWHAAHQDTWLRPPRGAHVVLSIMDLNFLERSDYSSAKKARRMAAVQRRVDRASGIATISAFTASVVRTYLRVPDIPFRVIHLGNPLEGPERSPVDPPTPPSLRELTTQPFFLFVGVLHPKKNVHSLLPVLRGFPDHRLVIAGPDDHPYAVELRERARGLEVSDRVVIPGAIDESTKRWLYARCRALLFPSLSEGFGLPVVEAMSFGKPVFLSRLTSLPEVGGSRAFYFDSFDPESMATSIRDGLADFDRRPDSADELRAWASRFSWDRAAVAYYALYDEARRSPPR